MMKSLAAVMVGAVVTGTGLLGPAAGGRAGDVRALSSTQRSGDVVLPQHCPPLVSVDDIVGVLPNFTGAVRQSDALTTLTIRHVEWIQESAMTASFGFLQIDGTEQGTDRSVTIRAASQCAEAAVHLAHVGPGSMVTVLTEREYRFPGSPPPGDPWVVTMWLNADWEQFLLGFSPAPEFEAAAADRSLDPFDLVRALIASARSCVADAAARAACAMLHPLVSAAEWRDSRSHGGLGP